MSNIVGYARVSTKSQKFDSQVKLIEEAGCDKIYVEVVRARNKQKPEFEKMMKSLHSGDTLVIFRIDRLGRSVKDLTEISDTLIEKGVELRSIMEPRVNLTSIIGISEFGESARQSEIEWEVISQRTRSGLESANARGIKGGRPRVSEKLINKALEMYDSPYKYTIKEIVEKTKVSKPTLYRELAKRKKEDLNVN